MEYMFLSAAAYNQPMNDWDVSKVTTMAKMFYRAAAYNQPMNVWDVSKVTDMNSMFYNATAFNQNLCAWGEVDSFPFGAVTDMFRGTSCANKTSPTNGAVKGPFCADDCSGGLF